MDKVKVNQSYRQAIIASQEALMTVILTLDKSLKEGANAEALSHYQRDGLSEVIQRICLERINLNQDVLSHKSPTRFDF
jgi:hypothetical protein